PIVLPVVLIGGSAFLEGDSLNGGSLGAILPYLRVLGEANVSMLIGTGIAMATVARQCRSKSTAVAEAIQTGLAEAGVIILIVGAGGAFGGLLQQCGIAQRIQELSSTYQLSVILLAFIVTALVRIAQGSATVAMITAVGVVGGMAT